MQRYTALDGLRGLLALAVVVHHYALLAGQQWLNSAWMAVDAFFIISGFILSHTYCEKIINGMPLSDFMFRRIERLYPLYFIGTALGILCSLIVSSPFFSDQYGFFSAALPALILLPTLDSNSWRTHGAPAFPMNDPSGSLFFELIIGIFFFFTARIKSVFIVAIGFGLVSVLYAFSVASFSPHSGYATGNFLGGFPRVVFFFSAGMLIYSLHRKIPLQRISFFVATALLITVFCFRNIWLLYTSLLVIAPLTILFASRFEPSDSCLTGRILLALGKISFPIYILHFPLAIFIKALLPQLNALDFVIVGLFLSIGAAYLGIKIEPKLRNSFRVGIESLLSRR